MPARVLLSVLISILSILSCQRQNGSSAKDKTAIASASTSVSSMERQGRIFPFSVVAGGLDSPGAMRNAMQDPVVRDHYASLEPATFRAETLKEDKRGHVSYRVGNKVYWTRRQMTLKKGELVLTDGKQMLRGRCGNRVSAVVLDPVAPLAVEPTEAVLDRSVPAERVAGVPPTPEKSPLPGALLLAKNDPAAIGQFLGTDDPATVGRMGPVPGGSNFVAVGMGGGGVGVGGGGVGIAPVDPTTEQPPLVSTPSGPAVPEPILPGSVIISPPGEIPGLTPPNGIIIVPPDNPRLQPPPNVWNPPMPPADPPPPLPPTVPPLDPPNVVAPPPDPPTTPPSGPPTGPPPSTPPPLTPPGVPPPPVVATPEPGMLWLVGGGLAALLVRTRFRRR